MKHLLIFTSQRNPTHIYETIFFLNIATLTETAHLLNETNTPKQKITKPPPSCYTYLQKPSKTPPQYSHHFVFPSMIRIQLRLRLSIISKEDLISVIRGTHPVCSSGNVTSMFLKVWCWWRHKMGRYVVHWDAKCYRSGFREPWCPSGDVTEGNIGWHWV